MSPAPAVDQALARVRDFVTRTLETGTTAAAIAAAADIDNKSVALARLPNWNPTAATLRKLEGLLPIDWRVGDPLPTKRERGAKAPEKRTRAADAPRRRAA